MNQNTQLPYLPGTAAEEAHDILTGGWDGFIGVDGTKNEFAGFPMPDGGLDAFANTRYAAQTLQDNADSLPQPDSYAAYDLLPEMPPAQHPWVASATGNVPMMQDFRSPSYQPVCHYPEPPQGPAAPYYAQNQSLGLPYQPQAPYYAQPPTPSSYGNPIPPHQLMQGTYPGMWPYGPRMSFNPDQFPRQYAAPQNPSRLRPSQFHQKGYMHGPRSQRTPGNGGFPRQHVPQDYLIPAPHMRQRKSGIKRSRDDSESLSSTLSSEDDRRRKRAHRKRRQMIKYECSSDDTEKEASTEEKVYRSSKGKISYDRKKKKSRHWSTIPSNFYTDHPPKATAWGHGNPSGISPFSYTKDGQWDNELTLSPEQLKYYLDNCPRKPTIWVQNFPAQCELRMDCYDKKCRYNKCPLAGQTMINGFHRVIFDEFPVETGNGLKDPFKVAGAMHLYCFEQCVDLLDYKHLLKPEARSFPKEEENRMALSRAPDLGAVENVYDVWFQSREGKPRACFPRNHTSSLTYAFWHYHITKQAPTRGTSRQARNKDKPAGIIKSIDAMKGDLHRYAKKRQQARALKLGNDDGEQDADYDNRPMSPRLNPQPDVYPESPSPSLPAPEAQTSLPRDAPAPNAGAYDLNLSPSQALEGFLNASNDANLQTGPFSGDAANSLVIPDSNIDPSLMYNFEFDLDDLSFLDASAGLLVKSPEKAKAASPSMTKRKQSDEDSPRSPKRVRIDTAQANRETRSSPRLLRKSPQSQSKPSPPGGPTSFMGDLMNDILHEAGEQPPGNENRQPSITGDTNSLFGSTPGASPGTPGQQQSSPVRLQSPRRGLRSSPRTPRQRRASLKELKSPENVRTSGLRRSSRSSSASRKSRPSI